MTMDDWGETWGNGRFYLCPSCREPAYFGAIHTCSPSGTWTAPSGRGYIEIKGDPVAKTHLTMRLPGDLVDAVEVMAAYRKEDKTTLITKMLRFALAQKGADCPHEEMENRFCVLCGKHFPEPSDDF